MEIYKIFSIVQSENFIHISEGHRMLVFQFISFTNLNPGTTMSRVIEVSNVDSPNSNTDDRNNLGQLFPKFIQFLLQRGLDFFSLRHLSSDLAWLMTKFINEDDELHDHDMNYTATRLWHNLHQGNCDKCHCEQT